MSQLDATSHCQLSTPTFILQLHEFFTLISVLCDFQLRPSFHAATQEVNRALGNSTSDKLLQLPELHPVLPSRQYFILVGVQQYSQFAFQVYSTRCHSMISTPYIFHSQRPTIPFDSPEVVERGWQEPTAAPALPRRCLVQRMVLILV